MIIKVVVIAVAVSRNSNSLDVESSMTNGGLQNPQKVLRGKGPPFELQTVPGPHASGLPNGYLLTA
jgi:hypothetical protein